MNSEQNFNVVMQRLKNISKASSYNALAEMMGLSSSAFANFKKRNSIPYDKVFALANSLKVSMDWLLTGEGEMYRDAANSNIVSSQQERAILEMYSALTDAQRKEISAAIEEKKRMNELVETVNQLQKKVG